MSAQILKINASHIEQVCGLAVAEILGDGPEAHPKFLELAYEAQSTTDCRKIGRSYARIRDTQNRNDEVGEN